MYRLQKGSSCILASLRQNNPSSTGMPLHKFRQIVYFIMNNKPAVTDLSMFFNLLPSVEDRHDYYKVVVDIKIKK